MPDVNFDMPTVRQNYTSTIHRLSMLAPIVKFWSKKPENVIKDVKKVLHLWRTRVFDLADMEYARLRAPGKRQFARNCPPVIVRTSNTKILRCCNMDYVCPWCYSRTTSNIYQKFASLLPSSGCLHNAKYSLLELRIPKYITYEDAGSYLNAPLLVFLRDTRRLIRRLDPLGAYFCVTLDPHVKRGKIELWRFQPRILALAPVDYEMPAWIKKPGRVTRITILKCKKDLIGPVARTRRYPVGLLCSDIEKTIIALNARRKTRCSEMSGILYGRNTVTIQDSIQNHSQEAY